MKRLNRSFRPTLRGMIYILISLSKDERSLNPGSFAVLKMTSGCQYKHFFRRLYQTHVKIYLIEDFLKYQL